MRVSVVFVIIAVVGARTLAAQACDEPHYRWAEKTSLDLLAKRATRVTISDVLRNWPVPELYRGASSACAARTTAEERVYSLTGWVRRRVVEEPPDGDGDWHIELTSSRSGAVEDHCMVVEIPDPSYGHQYRIARDDFDRRLSDQGITIDSHGDLSQPIRLRFIGPAFFDAEHRGARNSDNPPHGHGRCNSSSRALWEIHPVYAVRAPAK